MYIMRGKMIAIVNATANAVFHRIFFIVQLQLQENSDW